MDYFEKGNDLYNKKEYNAALSSYGKNLTILKKQNPLPKQVEETLYNMGLCYLNIKRYELACKTLKNIIGSFEIDENFHSSCLYNLGRCYIGLGEIGKAYQSFNMAFSLNPNNSKCEKKLKLLEEKFISANV